MLGRTPGPSVRKNVFAFIIKRLPFYHGDEAREHCCVDRITGFKLVDGRSRLENCLAVVGVGYRTLQASDFGAGEILPVWV
jgi:hypothetical protein